MYKTKLTFEKKIEHGEINEEPTKTIQGEYKEMKDILSDATKGTPFEARKVEYFAPDSVEKINRMFKNNLDLTDLDSLREKVQFMEKELTTAEQKAKAKLDAEKEKQRLDAEFEARQKAKKEPNSDK